MENVRIFITPVKNRVEGGIFSRTNDVGFLKNFGKRREESRRKRMKDKGHEKKVRQKRSSLINSSLCLVLFKAVFKIKM